LDGLKNDIKLKRSNYSFTGDPNLLSSFTRSTLLGYLLYASPISAQEIVGLTSTTVGIPDYLKYFLSGAICCSFSHGIGVPFDVVKTKKQISKDMSKLGILEIFKKIIADDGVGMLFKGIL
jgi:sugar (pentulose or hexulose) kinase